MGNLGKMALVEQTKRFNGQDNVETTNKLLAENTSEDREILAQLGLSNHALDSKLESLGEYTRMSELAQDWGYCISEDVLKDIAFKYDLTLGKSKYYKFSVPTTITSDIKDWTKKTGQSVRDSDDFYLLAPSEAFYNDDEYHENYHKPKCTNSGDDPMLVYEISGTKASGGRVYSLITEWGSDLNKLRKVKASAVHKAGTISILSVLSMVFMFTGTIYYGMNTLTAGLVGNDWVTIIMSIMTFVAMIIILTPLLIEIDGRNILKKDFNIYDRVRNFTMPVAQRFNTSDEKYEYKSYFGDIIGRFLVSSAAISVLFFAFMVSKGDAATFATELGYSGWYFTIPFGIVGVLFTFALGFNVFKNTKWE